MSAEQRNLFEMASEPWDEDDEAEQAVASVVFATGPGQTFDYMVPDALREQVEPGRRVRVPLGRGNRLVLGYCVAVENRRVGPRRLKAVAEVVDGCSLLVAGHDPPYATGSPTIISATWARCWRPSCRPAFASRPARG